MSKLINVACRLPHGLIIEVGAFGSPQYKSIKLNGPHSINANGQPSSIIVNGHAFTQVPEDIWNEWRKAHMGAEYLKNRMIYAEESLESAKEATKLDEAKGATGFEPLNPDKTPTDIESDGDALKQMRAEAARMRA